MNTAIKLSHPNEPLRIRAFQLVYQTGEIILHFETQGLVAKVLETEAIWFQKLHPKLKFKTKLYTIMVHGMPTSFYVTDPGKIRRFQFENNKLLDSLKSIRWTCPNSMKVGKHFSSIFISL